MKTTAGRDDSPASAIADRVQQVAEQSLGRLDDALGGRARRHVLLLLAAILGLSSADQATIGASATQLRAALNLSNTDLGLIASVSGLVGAAATIPLGALVDRVNRTRLLAIALVGWAVVMAASAAATSFLFLVLIRCALGGVVAVATPAVASLIGDYFPAAERGRIWGYVLTGELVGSGFGLSVAGGLASISWRVSFFVLALPAIGLAVLFRRLPEPVRGGAARLPIGAPEVRREQPQPGDADAEEPSPMSHAQQAAAEGETEPISDLVLDEEPTGWPLMQAVRYVLRIRTNVILIITGAAGYFFFAGVRAFGIEFVKGQYGIGQGVASMLALLLGACAIGGVLVSGRLSDRLGARGHLNGRVYVAAVALSAATLLFIPSLLLTQVVWAVLSLSAAGFFLAAVNPPLDAARLDIMHPTLWGRAEAVRTVLRQPAESAAPLIFGVLADHLFNGGHQGLQAAFLLMLVPLGASVAVLLRARHTYPRDVATAAESIERTCDL
ncbi:MAG TPA: MFS transporter [Mycobacteriales bacterium]|nr:MFS transporter [Mycobacteriales bacterium]